MGTLLTLIYDDQLYTTSQKPPLLTNEALLMLFRVSIMNMPFVSAFITIYTWLIQRLDTPLHDSPLPKEQLLDNSGSSV